MDIYPGYTVAASNDGRVVYYLGNLYLYKKRGKVWKQLTCKSRYTTDSDQKRNTLN